MSYKLPEISPEERLRIIRERRYETINSAAERLGVGADAIRKWIKAGKIPGMKVEKAAFVLTEYIDAFFAASIMLPDTTTIPDHLRGAARKQYLREVLEEKAKDASTQLP
jgi:hypothetical protein